MTTTKPALRSGLFIPCPSCQRAIELPLHGRLPQRLNCPNCGKYISR
jgi:endogenous inhibitor of DNA gyrase (YacG/DUF329 family)